MEATPLPPDPSRRAQIPRLCVLLGRAERDVRRSLAAGLTGLELTTDEFLLLAACDAPALPGQTELTTVVALSAAQTSTLLERLRQKNWLTAERNNADRRRQVWGLTPAGRAQLEVAWRALTPVLSQLTDRLPRETCEQLSRTLSGFVTPLLTERRCA